MLPGLFFGGSVGCEPGGVANLATPRVLVLAVRSFGVQRLVIYSTNLSE